MITALDNGALIGAHAASQCDRLLTRDWGYYKKYFDGLAVIDPATYKVRESSG